MLFLLRGPVQSWSFHPLPLQSCFYHHWSHWSEQLLALQHCLTQLLIAASLYQLKNYSKN